MCNEVFKQSQQVRFHQDELDPSQVSQSKAHLKANIKNLGNTVSDELNRIQQKKRTLTPVDIILQSNLAKRENHLRSAAKLLQSSSKILNQSSNTPQHPTQKTLNQSKKTVTTTDENTKPSNIRRQRRQAKIVSSTGKVSYAIGASGTSPLAVNSSSLSLAKYKSALQNSSFNKMTSELDNLINNFKKHQFDSKNALNHAFNNLLIRMLLKNNPNSFEFIEKIRAKHKNSLITPEGFIHYLKRSEKLKIAPPPPSTFRKFKKT